MGLITQECANYREGNCLGIPIDCGTCNPLPACLVSKGLPCAYFEVCVMPLAHKMPVYQGADRNYAAKLLRDSAKASAEAGEVFVRHPFNRYGGQPKVGKGRLCACGELLDKGKRLCPTCRKERGREARREHMRRLRESEG